MKGSKSHSTVREHAQLAQSTLFKMVEDRKAFGRKSRIAPDTDSFNYVIRAWTRCRKSADVADLTMAALQYMETYQRELDSSVQPNIKSYGLVLDSLSCRVAIKAKLCKDKTDDQHNGHDDLELMENVIQVMHKRGGDLYPSTYIYNIFITAWGHLARIHPRKAPHAAERLLQQMIRFADQGYDQLRPDARSYMLVMRAWMNTRLQNRAQRAAWWLDKQWQDYEFDLHPERRPTTESYNIVIRMFSEMGQPEQAEEYFKAMGEDEKGIRRNSESFVYLIKAWIAVAEERTDIHALQKAAEWLNYSAKLEEEDSAPGVKSSIELYCRILKAARACAPRSPTESLKLALDIFARLKQSHHRLGHLEYARLVQVGLLSLSRPENNDTRTKFIRQVVMECADAGLINGALLRTISKGPIYDDGWTIQESHRLTAELFGEWPFPHSWTRNVRDNGYLPRPNDLIRTHSFGTFSHDEDPYKE